MNIIPRLLPTTLFLFLTTGCSLPPVKIESDEPLGVDIKMRLDVYQHAAQSGAANSATRTSTTPTAPNDANPALTRRRRMEEVQNLKNSRLIGENRTGKLEIRTEAPGPYGEYVRRIVAEENSDRIAIMDQSAADRGVSLDVIAQEQGELWRTRSFNGEWIEIRDEDGEWSWQRKRAISAEDPEPTITIDTTEVQSPEPQ